MLESTHACSSRGLVRRKGGGQQLVAPLRVDLSGCKYGLREWLAGGQGTGAGRRMLARCTAPLVEHTGVAAVVPCTAVVERLQST